MKRRLEAVAALGEQGNGALHAAHEPRQVVSPYLTSREAVAYLRLPSLSSLYSHIRENKLPVCRAGGDLRFDTRELDAWLRGAGSALELTRNTRLRA